METYASRRRMGVGDEPNNAATDDSLGENWRSALCVTSLYDSYVAVQHENDALKDQLRQLQHANELLVVANNNNSHSNSNKHRRANKLRPEMATDPTIGKQDDDVDDDNDALAQELRLIRAEKVQQELLFDKRRVQLEAQLDQHKALYAELQAKYQQKFDFDPLAPQRVAVSTRALQQALDQSAREKEELMAEHTRLVALYQTLEADYATATTALATRENETAMRKMQDGRRTAQRVLAKWVVTRMARAWQQWRLVTLSDKIQSQQLVVEKQRSEETEAKRQAAIANRAAKCMMKLVQNATKRSFWAWKQFAHARHNKRLQLERVWSESQRKVKQMVWTKWSEEIATRRNLETAASRLQRVLYRHTTRCAWHHWTQRSAQVHAARQQQTIDRLQAEVARLQSLVGQLTEAIEVVETERDALAMQAQQTAIAHDAHAAALTQFGENAQQRVGDVLFRRVQRLTLHDSLFGWRHAAQTHRRRREKITTFQYNHQTKRITNAVSHWHRVAHEQRHVTHITRQVVQRLRLLNAYRCFIAWREFAVERTARVATLTRVVGYMKNQCVLKCFRSWTQYCTIRRSQRQRLTAVAVIVTRIQLAQSFGTWKTTATAIAAAAEKLSRQKIEHEWRQRLEQSKHELKQLRVYFLRWHRSIRSEQRVRQLTTKYALKWKSSTQSKCFEAWKALVTRRRLARELVLKLANRWVGRAVQNAWTRWRTQTLVLAKHEALETMEQERNALAERLEQELNAMRLADAASKATSAEREHELMTALAASQAALAMAQSACSQFKTALETVCLTRYQQRQRWQCFRAWQDAVRDASRRDELVANAQKTNTTNGMQRVLKAWHRLANRRKRIVVAVTRLQQFEDASLVSQCYRTWQQFALHHRTVRIATETFAIRSCHRHCRTVFTAWRHATRSTRLLRKTLEQIWLTSVHAHVRERFTYWREQTLEARVYDELQRKHLALDAIRTRVCARWTTCSLQAVVTAWRRGVEIQKSERLGVERLQRLHDQRLFSVAFGAWRSFHAMRQAQSEWLKTWDNKQTQKMTNFAWKIWRDHTIERRQNEVAILAATCREHEQSLAAKEHEIAELVKDQEQLTIQVESLRNEHADVGETASQLAKQLVITKCFVHWRIVASAHVAQTARVDRFVQRRRMRQKRTALYEWAAMVECERVKQQSASQFCATRDRKGLRLVLSALQSFTLRQRIVTRLSRGLCSRRARQSQRFVFSAWQAFVQRSCAVQCLTQILDKTAPKLVCHQAFRVWHHATQCHKTRLAQETEKQRRVLAFLMDKQAYALTKCFAAWRVLGRARHVRMEKVHALTQRTKQRRLQELWTTWRAYVQWRVTSASVIDRWFRSAARHHTRMAFQHWRTQTINYRLETLRLEAERRGDHHQILQSDLEAARSEAAELREAVATQEELWNAAEQARLATEASATAQVHNAQRRFVLTKLLSRVHCVPMSSLALTAAFHRWQYHVLTRNRWDATLRRLETLVLRKLQARNFYYWRRRVAIDTRLENAMTRRNKQVLRERLWMWTQWVRDRARRRERFIVRWIDATHVRQTEVDLTHKIAMAFRLWRLHATAAAITDELHTVTTTSQANVMTQNSHQRQRMLLAKWCWRAYHTRCHGLRAVMTQWRSIVERETIDNLQRELQKSALEIEAARQSATVGEAVIRGVQTVFRRLAAASSCIELFDAVASSISHVSAGNASGVLYLLDPTTNELWTQRRDASHATRAPAAMGLAGRAVSSLSTLLVEDATTDARFHPLVDQLVVSGIGVTANVHLFSTAIVGIDGAAIGVVQIAFTASKSDSFLPLLGHVCGFFVEQLVYEMVRHARDRVQARSPPAFTKLFKQTKNWRKYFVRVEREADKTAQQLKQLMAEQDALATDKAQLQQAWTHLEQVQRDTAHERATTAEQSEKYAELLKHVLVYKKKTAKLKALVEEKERLLSDKNRECERVGHDLASVRQELQSREWHAMLTAASPRKRAQDEKIQSRKPNHVVLEGAEVAALQNQLVRAESDSLLLVQAVDVAMRRHGELPETLHTEVQRIAHRLKKPRD